MKRTVFFHWMTLTTFATTTTTTTTTTEEEMTMIPFWTDPLKYGCLFINNNNNNNGFGNDNDSFWTDPMKKYGSLFNNNNWWGNEGDTFWTDLMKRVVRSTLVPHFPWLRWIVRSLRAARATEFNWWIYCGTNSLKCDPTCNKKNILSVC